MSFSRFDPTQESFAKEQLQSAMNTFRSQQADQKNKDSDQRARAAAQKQVDDVNSSLEQRKALDRANKRTADYSAGIVDPQDAADEQAAQARAKEAGMSDFQRYSQKNDYDLSNQTKAWESANTLRMREADQSNVAQKDRLVSQLDNQKNMQQSGFNQTNKLRSDDNRRAIDGFKMSF